MKPAKPVEISPELPPPLPAENGSVDDERAMRRALELAASATALASPNPLVGAVLVRDGAVLGEGVHFYERRTHAEIAALEQARQLHGAEAARGATLYINLEPCSHQGRTPPCADQLVAAGIARAVVAMEDPNPRVQGAGIARLRAAGVAVDVGLLGADAQRLNEAFCFWIRTQRPFVTLKVAMTMDGVVAPPPEQRQPGQPFWITGEAARAHVQELRHAHDAILTGVSTVLSDDPLLTDRTARPRRRPLLRVVLDSSLRTPLESALVRSAAEDLLLICAETAERDREAALVARGVEVVRVPASAAGVDLASVLAMLGERAITSLLVEAGPRLTTALLDSGLANKLWMYQAPRLAGEPGALRWLTRDIARPPLIAGARLHRFGADFAVECYPTRPGATHRN